MKTSNRLLAVTVAALAALSGANLPIHGADAGAYHFIKEIPIDTEGGWDYLSIDPTSRRLFVSHATKIVVVDIDKEEIAGEIADTPGIHGFAIAADLGRGFSSNGRENKVSIVDLQTLKTLSKVETGENPDAILYEPGHKEVYAFNGRGRSASVIDAKSGKVVATIPLPGKPEFATADPEAGRVFCNIEDKSEVVAIDTKEHKVVATWTIAPGEEPSGMAIDVANHRLFLGCGNKQMVMMDNTTGKVVCTVPIGDGVDANVFDPGTQLAFSSCGEGITVIAREETPDKLTVAQKLTTQPRARTMAIDPKTHKIYLATGPRQRQTTGPSTFKILVYGM
jgi:DNA-binding beta-propeller fold protein YncE